MRRLAILLALLPLAGCWWMLGEGTESSIRLDEEYELSIRNPNATAYYTVDKVLDGNTIAVSGYDKPIQLLGVAAPGHTKHWNNYYTKDAYLHLKKLLEGKTVQLYDDMFDEVPFRVWRGKVLAYVFLNGRLVNRHLIEQGFARVEREHNFFRWDEFIQAEERARRNHAGLWAVTR